jgi:antitoxin component YwqK of YwqJK toxin-antitoxin module
MNNKKVLYENNKKNGDIIYFYEDNIISLLETNKRIHLIFEDGAILTNDINNDLRLILPNGDILFNHKNSNSFEINYYKDNYTLIRYLGGYIEKLFFNGIKINKNPNSKETIISLLDNNWMKMFNNNGKLLKLAVNFK